MKLRSLAVARVGVIAFATLAAACGREQTPPPPPAAPPAAAAADAVLEMIQVRRPDDGQIVATLRLTADDVTLRFDDGGRERVLHSRRDDDGKHRRYREHGGGTVALARPNPEAGTLTVRRQGGELRWRVRFGKHRILAEDHPELPAFELRQPNDDTVRVRQVEGAELGRVAFGRDDPLIQVRGPDGEVLYRIRGERHSALYGVLLVPDLDPVERYVLMAELLLHDQ